MGRGFFFAFQPNWGMLPTSHSPRRGGGIGRHTGLKILRAVKGPYRFDSGPRHHAFPLTSVLKQPSRKRSGTARGGEGKSVRGWIRGLAAIQRESARRIAGDSRGAFSELFRAGKELFLIGKKARPAWPLQKWRDGEPNSSV